MTARSWLLSALLAVSAVSAQPEPSAPRFVASSGALPPVPVSFSAVLELPVTTTGERVSYGDAPQQHATLWLPKSSPVPAPVIVLRGSISSEGS